MNDLYWMSPVEMNDDEREPIPIPQPPTLAKIETVQGQTLRILSKDVNCFLFGVSRIRL
jgi:hypothetical protein